jgi:hypothetical protein
VPSSEAAGAKLREAELEVWLSVAKVRVGAIVYVLGHKLEIEYWVPDESAKLKFTLAVEPACTVVVGIVLLVIVVTMQAST